MTTKLTPPKERPDRYEVSGFVPRAKLTLYEQKELGGRGKGLWIPIRTVAAWSPRGAIKKVVDQAWVSDLRVTRYRAKLLGPSTAEESASSSDDADGQLRLPF